MMKNFRLICLFLLLLNSLSATETATISTSPNEYTKKNHFTSHIIAGGKEVCALFKKMINPLKVITDRDPNKKAVLLVHGLNSSPKDWHMLFNDLQSQDFEVYTIYLSYWKKGGYSESVKRIQTITQEILTVHPDVDIVGHSLGGLASVDAINHLGPQQTRIKRLITVNSPLNGTTLLNTFTKMFIPRHLTDILTYQSDYVTQLQKDAVQTQKSGVRFFHTATESDHLVTGIDTNFLQVFEEGIIVTGEGHLSTLNAPEVRRKIIEWLKSERSSPNFADRSL